MFTHANRKYTSNGLSGNAGRPSPGPDRAPLANQTVQRLLISGRLQAKLTVNQPGDRYEREADRVADQVMRGPEPARGDGTRPPQIQRRCAECEEEAQRQAMDGEETIVASFGNALEEDDTEPDESGMPKREAGSAAAGETGVLVPRGPGQPLEPGARRFLEDSMGHDFSGVRIHADGEAARSARELRAHAYTVGRDVYFNEGAYRPASPAGRKLLAHELTHVVQQTGGAPSVQRQEEETPAKKKPASDCPQGKQSKVVHNDCAESGPADESDFIRHLAVSIADQKVRATWGAKGAKTATRTDEWDCSPNSTVTPKGSDKVGVKCGVHHTNRKKDGMAWFIGFKSEGLRIGFHDSQRVGKGIESHGCVRVFCSVAKKINQNTWSGVTTIKVK